MQALIQDPCPFSLASTGLRPINRDCRKSGSLTCEPQVQGHDALGEAMCCLRAQLEADETGSLLSSFPSRSLRPVFPSLLPPSFNIFFPSPEKEEEKGRRKSQRERAKKLKRIKNMKIREEKKNEHKRGVTAWNSPRQNHLFCEMYILGHIPDQPNWHPWKQHHLRVSLLIE